MHPLAHLGFQQFTPHPSLADYIQCYWYVSCDQAAIPEKPEFMHPEGGSGLIFNWGDAVTLNGEIISPGVWVSGPMQLTNRLQLSRRVKMLGVRFKPGAGSLFLSNPLDQLQGRHFQLDDLNLHDLQSSLSEQLDELPLLTQKVQRLETQLLRQIDKRPITKNPLIELLQTIQGYQGSQPVQQLVESQGIQWRRLDRGFKHWVGLTPKAFSRLCQVRYARQLLKRSNPDAQLTDVGYQAGFYDQAHFIKQFRRVVGITPGEYRRKAQHLNPSF